ncbi:MAG: hypothetical protein JWS12_748 [Candidatus Saccharibacteria bacterium]|nr:hypothetical protein [Candidatus Saccharibacteria bacterium]
MAEFQSGPAFELHMAAIGVETAILDATDNLYYGPSGLVSGVDTLRGHMWRGDTLIQQYPEVPFAEICEAQRIGTFFLELNKLI